MHSALRTFNRLLSAGLKPNIGVVISALKVCSRLGDLQSGARVHASLDEDDCISNVFLGNAVLIMYAKCGSLAQARRVFDNMRQRNAVSWNSLILGYAQKGQGHEALQLFFRMQDEGCTPDGATLVAVLKACADLAGKEEEKRHLELVRSIQALAVVTGELNNIVVASSLVDTYFKCGSVADARNLFENMQERNVVSWTAVIMGYAQSGQGREALHLYARMQHDGCCPNAVTFVAALKACGSVADENAKLFGGRKGEHLRFPLTMCRLVHAQAAALGEDLDIYVASTLMDTYFRCGVSDEARQVFERMPRRSVVTWNCIIQGYAEAGESEASLEMYDRLLNDICATQIDRVTVLAVLKACSCLAEKEAAKIVEEQLIKVRSLSLARTIHLEAAKIGCSMDSFVLNSLVDTYSKCGCMREARAAFDKLLKRTVVSWNNIIQGYAQNGECEDALRLYSQMRNDNIDPDALTFVACLKACANMGALDNGKLIHSQVVSRGLVSDLVVVTSLVDFYAKCGCMVQAQEVFDLAPVKNVVTWGALLSGYSRQGNTERIFELFEDMLAQRVKPDSVTFLCILTACSHAGLVDKAMELVAAMERLSGVKPSLQHYNCIVDLLGRANKVEAALQLVNRMPCRPNEVTWMSLLNGCRKWKNLDVGRLAFESLLKIDDQNSAAYVLMSKVYAAAEMLDEASKLQAARRCFRMRKDPGQSWWIDSRGRSHSFMAKVGCTEHRPYNLLAETAL